MSSTYNVKVNSLSEFEFTEQDISEMDIIKDSNSSYHLIHNHQSYQTKIVKRDFASKKYTISVNGNSYQVAIHDILDMQIKEMGFSLGSSKQIHQIKAPMPGLLLDVHVKIGQQIKEDDPLFILEAMKMENSILSPRDGVIKSISAVKGTTVDKGELLIEFEK
ncbi:acetyl-CoA carboxylase biotin carboxyl carrier protein subunit [Aquimarina sp. 2201CG1-2-11]|uniref:acetyl-CoA carboxylase biotin carboxyl carrier protein subunit n=1 Tax=Aquimarina discodermiae TaxID=3231043 RepID=UPI0034636F3A